MQIKIPEFAIVSLIGASANGKTTFAQRHFSLGEVEQYASEKAAARLKNKQLVVIDNHNIAIDQRQENRVLSTKYQAPHVAIVFNLPLETCLALNKKARQKNSTDDAIKEQHQNLKQGMHHLLREKYQYIYYFNSQKELDAAKVLLEPMPSNLKKESGPFDIIGDVHGCYVELVELLKKIGYEVKTKQKDSLYGYEVVPPKGRKVVFVGDYVDRGPENARVLKLVMSMAKNGVALCVPGNHDDKLKRRLMGRKTQLKHGLKETMEEMEKEGQAFRDAVLAFLGNLPSHLELDGGKLVIAHAGLEKRYHGRISSSVWSFCLYGKTTGKVDKNGMPERLVWAKDYHSEPLVVYGHTPVPKPDWINKTVDIDTGCVFGGELTALRYPEMETIAVAAKKQYSLPGRPIMPLLGEKGPDVEVK